MRTRSRTGPDTDDPARIAGGVPLRGTALAGRLDVDQAEDLSAERFPFKHRRANCWIQRAGNRWKVYICTYDVPGGNRSHREMIVRELTAIYSPKCNSQQYDRAWKDEWIGEYAAPTTGPLTTGRGPDDDR